MVQRVDRPPRERARPAALASARRLLPPGGSLPSLDRLAGLAARLLGAPGAQVCVVGERRSVVGGFGLGAPGAGTEGPLEASLCQLVAAQAAPVAVDDARADPRVAHLDVVERGAVAAYLGTPVRDRTGLLVGTVCVMAHRARAWTAQEAQLLAQVATSVAAELELAATARDRASDQVLRELAVDAAGIGTFDVDLAGGLLTWDERTRSLFGPAPSASPVTTAEAVGWIHPDDRERVLAEARAAVAAGGRATSEFRLQVDGGDVRWVAVRGRVLLDDAGAPGRLLGAVYDVTSQHEARAAIEAVLESMATGFTALDRSWRCTYVNAAAERLLGVSRAELLGRVLWEVFPVVAGTVVEERCRRVVETGETAVFEVHHPGPDRPWYELRAERTPDGIAIYTTDVTAAHHVRDEAAATTARADLFAEVTSRLTATLDAEEAVRELAQLVVPALADWCIVTLADDDVRVGNLHGLRDVAWWHARPDGRPLLATYARHRMAALGEGAFLLQALASGQPVAVQERAWEAVRDVLRPGPAQDALVALAPQTFVALPLRGRGRTVGLLSLYNDLERGPMTPGERGAAAGVADRAGLALDSARLYRQQREIASGLQRSLLTAPPQVEHVQIAVRYRPAAEAAQVGGDWYDAYVQPDGATVLVIGDVIGHDTQAAAAMSQVRTIVRTLGALDGAGPASVLRRTDEVMDSLQLGATATAVVARLELDADQVARGHGTLRWSNAGHPPPVVLHPDGAVMGLTSISADLLLGVEPSTHRRQSEVVLPRGATVVLYTDGLVERRHQPLQEGLERLQEVLEELGGDDLDLDALVDEVLDRMLPARPEDDVAVIAVRLVP